ncbi:MAG: hypothetical protein M3255_04500, partial [Pseudomonadota bacterium]|nr:hypothetical protein [Pseudomonadota bacterium]
MTKPKVKKINVQGHMRRESRRFRNAESERPSKKCLVVFNIVQSDMNYMVFRGRKNKRLRLR